MLTRPVNAGALDHRITLQSKVRAIDNQGGAVDTWADVATVWASIRTRTLGGGAETTIGDKLQSQVEYIVGIRRRSDVNASMRAVWLTNSSKVLNIRAVNDEGPRAEMQLLYCEMGVAD